MSIKSLNSICLSHKYAKQSVSKTIVHKQFHNEERKKPDKGCLQKNPSIFGTFKNMFFQLVTKL